MKIFPVLIRPLFILLLLWLFIPQNAALYAAEFESNDLALATLRAGFLLGNSIFTWFRAPLLEPYPLPAPDSIAKDRSTGIFTPQRLSRDVYGYGGYSAGKLPPGYTVDLRFDSTLSAVRKSESYGGLPTVPSNSISMDSYLELRKEKERARIWDSLVRQYDLKKAMSAGDLAKVLSQATGLSIPIPPNPIMSIFGKPEISINVSGDVNVRAGWQWDSQRLGTASPFGQTQSGPFFTQDINLNVTGRIGDKLRLGVDWNTRQQFDLNNRFNIGFSGNDDDIFKRIEVGNVQFPTPSTLIGGSQSLFGVRADFQFGPLFLKTVASQRRGESRRVNVSGGGTLRQPFRLNAYDYDKKNFFLDTAYFAVWDSYYKPIIPIIPNTPQARFNRVKLLEVYESTVDVQQAAQASEAIAIDTLAPINRVGATPQNYPAGFKSLPPVAGFTERGKFLKMDPKFYQFDENLGRLTITGLKSDRSYGVAYRIEGPTGANTDDLDFGTISNTVQPKDTLILKLVYRPNMQPGFKTIWQRQMRNIFSIGQTNVNLADLRLNVWYLRPNNDSSDVLEGSTQKVVTILGVDRVNNSDGTAKPDGLFDLGSPQQQQQQQQITGGNTTNPGSPTTPANQLPTQYQQQGSPFFNPVRGEVIFPERQPFDSGLVNYFATQGSPQTANRYRYPQVYQEIVEIAKRSSDRDRFIISGEATGTFTTGGGKISLGAFNLSPGSVKVMLDGTPLRENQDYYVEYFTGQVTLTNPRATLPNANLSIEYEQNDLFNLATRTMLGLRADLQVFKRRSGQANLGLTYMHFNQALLFDRVRVNEEPVSNSMLGLDGNLNLDLPFLTKALDAMPFYDTKEKSSLTLRGEIAAMMPTPNKRISDIPSDNGAAVAYVDDFEGAQRSISLGLTPQQWSHISMPEDSTLFDDPISRAGSYYRGSTYWYQFFLGRTPITDVYPNRDTRGRLTTLNDLKIRFFPDERGIYNRNPRFVDRLNPAFAEDSQTHQSYLQSIQPKVWGGLQRLFSTFNTNFETENIDFMEMVVKFDQVSPESEMWVDLGQISEDVIANNTLNTEDGITAAAPIPNNIIDPGEDVGYDALNDAEEKSSPTAGYPDPLNREADPARDNFFFNFGVDRQVQDDSLFRRYNNFENNATQSESGQFPDREILNNNNGQTIALDNSYFSYKINLDLDPRRNPQIVGEGKPGARWYFFRIPLRRPTRTVGNPTFSNIQYVRVWFKGGPVVLNVAEWRFTGGQWIRNNGFQPNVSAADSVLSVQFVNLEENSGLPDRYSLPPGVQRPRQINNPDPLQDVRLNEQSLSVGVKNLPAGQERMAVRIFRNLDIFYYKKLKFFLHGDGTMPTNLPFGATPRGMAFIRFGLDSANYYEVRRPLLEGWRDISIDLQRVTQTKEKRSQVAAQNKVPVDLTTRFVDIDSVLDPSFSIPVQTEYVIKGNPILTRIQFLGFGIANPSRGSFPEDLSTTMWLNELRITEPESSTDWAGVGSAELKLADLGTINASYNQSNPNFHRLEERFGNRNQTLNWNVQMQGSLEKLLPKEMKDMKIPISYTHSESIENPQFAAQSDVGVESATRAAYQAELVRSNGDVESAARISDSVRKRSQTLRVQDSWAITGFRMGIPVQHWLIRETFNKITISYDYSQTFERSPVVEERFRWNWRMKADYSVQIPQLLTIKPLGWISADFPILGGYKDWKIIFLPASFSTSVQFQRSRITEKSRFLPFASPVVRDFAATRQAQFTWRFSENGLLSPILDYSFTTGSTLVPYELDENGRQREGNDVFRRVLFYDGRVLNFGQNTNHTQVVTLNIKPRLPDLWGLANYMDNSGTFSTTYTWRNPLQQDTLVADAVKQASWQNTIRLTSNIRLKGLTDKWWKIAPGSKPDSSSSFLGTVGRILKTIFFDYETITLNFRQENSSINQGVLGETGMTNMWRGFGFMGGDDAFGPSAAYQLGLVSQPHGGFRMRSSSSFPFIAFETFDGKRPKNSTLPENFFQKSELEFRTNRPLWQGATLDLNWKSSFGFNRNRLDSTDAEGNSRFTNVVVSTTYNRTYLSLPKFLFFAPLNNTIQNVIDTYNGRRTDIQNQFPNDTLRQNQALRDALTQSFEDGLGTSIFGFLPRDVLRILPAMNWTLRWDGVEKLPLFGGLAKRVTFEHAYKSTYQESSTSTDNGTVPGSQQIQSGFEPLIGLQMSFDETKMNGILTSSLRYTTKNNYTLQPTSSVIQGESVTDITLQTNYNRRGFKFNLLGLELDNELEFALNATYKRTLRSTYDVLRLASPEGQKLDGNTQIIIEPSARYGISNRVTARFFIRYETTINEGAASPGFSKYQVGLDIRLSVSGGR
jgi:cell surface protein SprA